jgi:hypothetical protein
MLCGPVTGYASRWSDYPGSPVPAVFAPPGPVVAGRHPGRPGTGLLHKLSAFFQAYAVRAPASGSARRLRGSRTAGITKFKNAYRMSVVDLQSGKWYPKEISAATEAVEAK